MSGGVDSTVAAALLLRQGHRVTGVTMRLWDGLGASPPRRCGSREDMEAAAAMAGLLGIPHEIVDFRKVFLEKVVRPFCDRYLAGLTPNPCVVCNEVIKSELLLDHARRIGADAVATGHYARIDDRGPRPRLLRGLDPAKDQSYFLHRIGTENLFRVLFPLGEMKKQETRRFARELGLAAASRAESQEVCFVPAEGYTGMVERFGTKKPLAGSVVFRGRKLFDHEGIHNFTVGQRCGSPRGRGRRLYVRAIHPDTGDVEAAERKDLYFSSMEVRDMIWHDRPGPGPFEAGVKVRYRHDAAVAEVRPLGRDRAEIVFREPQFAVTPGQAAVIYDGEAVKAGGWISRAANQELEHGEGVNHA
jgi:tRNA-specific 2-thiouridylase